LRDSVRIGGPKPETKNAVGMGTFLGTRGRALPLVAATFEISGPGAGHFQLAVDALFLGSPRMTVAGQHVVLSGPTGREPMVGLRLRIEPIDRPAESEMFVAKSEQRAPAMPLAERVRVRGAKTKAERTIEFESETKSDASIKRRDVRVFRRQVRVEQEAEPKNRPTASKRKSGVRVFRKSSE